MGLLLNFIKKHKIFVIFFSAILVYDFAVVGAFKPWSVTGELYSIHLVDFSMGFCSRFLPGTVYNFFFDNTSQKAVTIYCTILFIVFIAFISRMLEIFVKSVDADSRPILLFILTYFVFGTFNFSIYAYRLGSLDFYWVSIVAFSIFCLSNKKLYFLLIPMSIISVIINYGSLTCYILLVVFIILYKITTLDDKKEKKILSFVLLALVISSYSLGFYFLMFEHNNLTYTLQEFAEILKDRGYNDFPSYFAMSLYEADLYDSLLGFEVNESLINNSQSPIISAITIVFYRVLATLGMINFKQGIVPFLLAFPVVILIFIYFRRKSRETTNKLRKITFFCMCAMFFVVIVSSLFLSVDIVRFISHAYTSLIVSALYVIYNEKGKDLKLIAEYIQRIPKWIITVYTFCFLFMIFDPCS